MGRDDIGSRDPDRNYKSLFVPTEDDATALDILERKRNAAETALSCIEIGSTFLYSAFIALYIICHTFVSIERSLHVTAAFAILIALTGIILSWKIWALRSWIKKIEDILTRDVSEPTATASRWWRDRLMEVEQMTQRVALGISVEFFKLIEPLVWLAFLAGLQLVL